MGYSILVIEDEENIRKIISDYFKAENYNVIEACDGKEGIEKFGKEKVDLIILDIMMPKLDGWTVCRRIRKQSQVPIIMLTARTEEDDELMGFELKADDYVKKPFSPAVLVARAKLLLMRKKNVIKEKEGIMKKQGLKVDKLAREVYIDQERVELTPKEFDILCYLMNHEGMVFSRDQILNSIWDYDFIGDTRVVDNHIKKLRKALKDKSYFIRTVFGVGYKFEVK
ncbi:response regulator transcription factor [Maledivibacter halophilus]|uniref:Stage 0 sporulation protein A homolog n=1 Tax=Maledivibacter halophilus TaxID=36842 RepID=A0A1T5MN61_9FIRM|nr:response regulator transcription factor [Maledivibacter halophilus]SKC89645.1 DNA-binding response regulator, OmpR family, contains REC and winged-helix (wHTH) domain [Maledivibacter halophilus]